MFLRPSKNLKHYGSWALITGSTGGIGRALASELASKGLNLVLLDRDPLELDATSQQIRKQNGGLVQVRTIAIDFAKQCGEEIAKRIEEEIEDLDVGILINNAGLAYPFARFFHELGLDLVESVVGVNIVGTTWVTRAVLPGMLKRKKGAIVNIGSGSSVAVSSYPLYTIYAATKAGVAGRMAKGGGRCGVIAEARCWLQGGNRWGWPEMVAKFRDGPKGGGWGR
ncbi:beta-ketoacyl reductase 1 [Actinidia rufa]|uniref:Beta-ketoacyl reductase 1 n=1 Tax=Actinidia rufa TaxID=165716 RepID=A0A7J0FMT9_9ERIC|nr:beta-ketoacyl reductase 1 [Actinidia rufa]